MCNIIAPIFHQREADWHLLEVLGWRHSCSCHCVRAGPGVHTAWWQSAGSSGPQGAGAGQVGAGLGTQRAPGGGTGPPVRPSPQCRPSAVRLPCPATPHLFGGPQHLTPELFQTFMPASVAPTRPSANFFPRSQPATEETFLNLLSHPCSKSFSAFTLSQDQVQTRGHTATRCVVPDFCRCWSPVHDHSTSVLRSNERAPVRFPHLVRFPLPGTRFPTLQEDRFKMAPDALTLLPQ